jgi:hypothetical protein
MFLSKLTQLVETHWEEIASGTIRRIRNDEDVPRMKLLSEPELRDWIHGILEALRSWKAAGEDDTRLALKYNDLGRLRFESAVPMYEVVRCLHILRLGLIACVRNHACAQNTLEMYAQEEWEYRVGLFFDWLLYNVALGYEKARRTAGRLAADRHN